MMETTPRTRSNTRYRRVPTPKMSERKKKLFDDVLNNGDSPTARNPYVRLERLIIEEGDDSDIGPMSPLEFSSSPSSFNAVHRFFERDHNENPKAHRIDFTNILNDDDDRSNDTGHSNKQVAPERANNSSTVGVDEAKSSIDGVDDMMGPLCNSMKKLTSMTEQNYEQQMKTPSDVSTTSKSAAEPIGRSTSFRKSLVFDSSLTPNDERAESPASKTSDHDHSGGGGGSGSGGIPKAKTSLTFNEPTISVRSFYGKPTVNEKRANDLIEKINSHEFNAAIAAVAAKHKMKIKSKAQSKKKSLAQRMKAAAAPGLWRFSGKAKFNHHKRHRAQKSINNNNGKAKLNTSTKSANDITDVENEPPAGIEFTSRIEQNLRLQKILKEQPNALNASREINWIGGDGSKSTTVDASSSMPNQSEFLHSDADDDDDDDDDAKNRSCTYEEVEVEVEEPTNRKFFKSKASNSAKKYRIMGRLSATVKRGGDLKFDPPPKRKKKRSSKGEETVVLHNEITSIIDRLSSPSKDKTATNVLQNNIVESIGTPKTIEPVNEPDFIDKMQTEMNSSNGVVAEHQVTNFPNDIDKYRQMLPYHTNDPEKISQQESILELLISNGICDDETFKIFIAEPDLHKDKASQIIDGLYRVGTMISNEYENEWINSVESMATTSDTAIASPPLVVMPTAMTSDDPGLSNEIAATVAAAPLPSPQSNTHDAESEKLFPIFNKNFNAKDAKVPTFDTLSKTSKDWIPIGDQQYQLDVGQKEFGVRTCPQCEMQYSIHEPEDELLHMEYHNRVQILTFKGWSNERVVTQISDWNPPGRIIYVCESDGKAKNDRVQEVLTMVDRDLGFATGEPKTQLKPKTLVYFAIAKEQIVGVCVAQPLERAHRMKTENGIDCSSIETYPVKCGISRIWVAPRYRRHGIAAKLITSIRGHFLFGAFLSFDEIAFSSPTEAGKKFAASLAQRNDFLIYES